MLDNVTAPLTRTGRAIWALTLRSFRSEYGDRQLGLFWAFAEPSISILVITMVMTFARGHAMSPLGGELMPFVTLGALPYFFYSTVESSVRSSVRQNRALLNFPQIKPIDLFIASMLSEFSALAVVFCALFAAFYGLGIGIIPDEPVRLIPVILVSTSLGFSIGVLNAIIINYYPFWSSIFNVFNRMLFFTSGLFFTAATAPPVMQKWLSYIPLLQLTEWARSAYYASFESKFFSLTYVLGFTSILLFLAFIAERTQRSALISKI
jgi:capsular polysaccharide transport system permease protein